MLTSLQNEQVKYVVNLHKRKFREKTGEYLIEGWRFVEEALRRGGEITKVFLCPSRLIQEEENQTWANLIEELKENGIPVNEVNEKVLRKISDTESPQGILAIVKQPRWTWKDIEETPLLLILDGIQDPGNCGTILRTALAAGVTQVCMTKGTVDLFNTKVLRSTMGAIFSLKILTNCHPEDILSYCRENKISIVTGDIDGRNLYEGELPLPLALVVGNEGNGPSEFFRGEEVQKITIPMDNEVESLNVAMATGIILYEICRQHGLVFL
ncbi:MAG: RNA methyltransferase [Desulfitobacterium sp.]|nr:RNA methyltransferase [Desulfitobacterium sp.]